MAADDELDEAIAAAAPRAPRDFGAAVEARLRRRERARGQRLAGAGALVTLAAAAMVLLLIRPTPPPAPDAWRVASAHGATLVGVDGTRRPLVGGEALVNGVHITVAPGGEASLTQSSATVILAAETAVRVAQHELEIERGSARLEGPESRVAINGTTVTALGVGAAVAVEARRSEMNAIKPTNLVKPILAGAAATLVAVTVYTGAARVQPAGGPSPVELAADDRLLLEPMLPPLVTRAKALPAYHQEHEDSQWYSSLSAAMHVPFARMRHCYEMSLDPNGKLNTHLVMRLHILKLNDHGVVESAELQPEGHNVNAPVTDQCLLEAVGAAELPAPSGDAITVDYAFPVLDVPADRDPPEDEMKLLFPKF